MTYEEYLGLCGRLQLYAKLYHEKDSPAVTDAEYDEQMRALRAVEAAHPEWVTPDSPSQKVGGAPSSAFAPVLHVTPLLSLNDVFSQKEIFAFDLRMREFAGAETVSGETASRLAYLTEPKVDGLSVALEYENGYFVRGATRGDGRTGEDVTHNLKTIRNLPPVLTGPCIPSKLTLRGEIYLPVQIFEDLNEERKETGLAPFANPRNAAAGSLRQTDPAVTASRGLAVVVFSILHCSDRLPRMESERLGWLQSLGIPVIPHVLCPDMTRVWALLTDWEGRRPGYPYDTDGAVVSADDLAMREVIGATARAPRWAVAYKFTPETRVTELTGITLQVGRTGVLTPRAELSPVRLAGTTVTAATLHNADFIREKDIRIGDRVLVRKAGEVIPEILGVAPGPRGPASEPFCFPKNCPVCGEPLCRGEDEAAVRCTGPDCPARLRRRLEHFASRNAMDIEGLGQAAVDALVTAGLVLAPDGLYSLTASDVLTLPGFAERSAENLIGAISRSKARCLSRLLFALGIRHIGEKAAFALARHFGDLQTLKGAERERLLAVPDIGGVMADSLMSAFASPGIVRLLDSLTAAGLNTRYLGEKTRTTLAGLSFVLTGVLPSLSRGEAARLIESSGGKVTASVSKKTSYVVVGTDPGGKRDRAVSLGVPLLDEEGLRHLLTADPAHLA